MCAAQCSEHGFALQVETAVLLFMLAVLVISSGTSLPAWQLTLLGPLYGLMFLASILPTWYAAQLQPLPHWHAA